MKRTHLTAVPSKRSWSSARAKVDSEDGLCRVCKLPGADAAHLIPRSAVRPGIGERAANVIPLCRAHHVAYDRGELDLAPLLTVGEAMSAVELTGGLWAAVRRVSGRTAA